MLTYTESTIHNSPYTNFVKIPYTKNHNHNFWEVIIVLSGSITHVINGEKFTNTQGRVTFLRPLKDSHYFLEEQEQKNSYRHRDIYISDEDMKKWCNMLGKTLYSDLYTPSQPCTINIQSSFINHIESSFFSPNFEATHNPTINKNVQLSVSLTLLTAFQVSQIPTALPPWINTFIQTLKNPNNFSTPVETLMQTIPYSHCHICREFKKYTGQTVVNFFIQQKISYASYLLVNTNHKIIDIANQVGYDSPKNFINQFTKTFQLPPSEWRTKNQILIKK